MLSKRFLSTSGASGTSVATVDFLVIAGGGGGGGANYNSHATAGGGGAGGYRNSYNNELSGGDSASENSLLMNTGVNYNVTVGAGGTGSTGENANANRGGSSTLDTITSIGGGGGASRNSSPPNRSGGSGGGGSYGGPYGAGTANQGFRGGLGADYVLYRACGGGGASGIGSTTKTTSSASRSSGGAAQYSQITGGSVLRARGGSVASKASRSIPTQTVGVNGVNAGNGGWGWDTNTGGNRNGAAGSIVVRYPNTFTISLSAGLSSGGGENVTGLDKWIIITAGTGTILFT